MTSLRALFEIPSAEALRDLLDAMNEAGANDRVSGIDALGEPFLAFLAGPYAETAWAYTYNPRDPERAPAPGTAMCPDCGCVDPFKLADLHYPVVVVR